MKKIYLACPFSHWFFLIRWWRFLVATRCAAKIMQDGFTVMSPVTHSFPIACFMAGHLMQSYKFWMKQDLPWVECCQLMIVLKFNKAWKKSKGVQSEINHYKRQYGRIEKFEPREILNGSYLNRLLVID